MKFTGGNYYYDHILGKIGTGTEKYERKFEPALINFAALSNRCRCLANEFINSLDVIADQVTSI